MQRIPVLSGISDRALAYALLSYLIFPLYNQLENAGAAVLLKVIPPSTDPQGETCPPTQAPNTAHHVQSAKVLLAKSFPHTNKL